MARRCGWWVPSVSADIFLLCHCCLLFWGLHSGVGNMALQLEPKNELEALPAILASILLICKAIGGRAHFTRVPTFLTPMLDLPTTNYSRRVRGHSCKRSIMSAVGVETDPLCTIPILP
jgi:hypothetical protein